jgi:hypothetical protein
MPADNSSAVAKPRSLVVWSSTRLGSDRRFFSTWSALGNPVFRKLWITRPNSFRLEMNVPSWNEHLLQKERMTQAEKELLQNAWSLHLGSTPPEERIYLSVSRELHTPRQCDYQPPGPPKKNLT